MELKRSLLCWGYGKIFEVLSFDRPVHRPNISLAAPNVAATMPFRLYPWDDPPTALEDVASSEAIPVLGVAQESPSTGAFDTGVRTGEALAHWVLEAPFLDYPALDIAVTTEGAHFSWQIDPTTLVAASDANFIAHPELCNALIAFSERFNDRLLTARALHNYDGDRGPIWRFEVIGAADVVGADFKPAFNLVDLDGNPVDFAVKPFENTVVTLGSKQVFKGVYSLELFADLHSFIFAISDPTGALAPGFITMNSKDLERARWDTWTYMRNLSDTIKAYRRWYLLQRPSLDEARLARERYESDEEGFRPLISFVIVLEGQDEAELTATILTLINQSYPYWELIFVHSPVPGDQIGALRAAGRKYASQWTYWGKFIASFGDNRLRLEALSVYPGRIGAINAGVLAAHGQWMALMDSDLLLDPGALARLVSTIDHYPEATLFFGDEDTINDEGELINPVLNSELNVDLLYSRNFVRHFLVVQRTQLFKIGLPGEDVYGALNYDIALRALAAGALFGHVPAVLCHVPDYPTSLRRYEFTLTTWEAERRALGRHFGSQNIPGNIELSLDPPTLRMRYALPEPAPLISIVIPNKDHIDVLRPCVRSLLDGATYPTFEIVIVENNSVDPETFAFYEALTAQDGRVRVVTWNGPFNYSAIINFGVAASRGDYLLLLNNDTKLISPDALETMVGFFNRPDVGVVGAKLYFRDDLVQHAGMLVGVHGAVAHVNQNFVRRRGGYLDLAILNGNFSAVTGACQMVSREVFDRVGGYEEALATGFNDVDFCLKAQEAGYRVVFTPYAEFYHYEFTSRERETENEAELTRWQQEKAWMHARWPQVFESGDPYLNPNLDPNNAYYNLPPA